MIDIYSLHTRIVLNSMLMSDVLLLTH